MRIPQFKRPDVRPWTPLIVTVAAMAFFLVTLCREAFPVESSIHVTTHTGIDPFQRYQNSLWTLLLWFVSKIPVGTLAFRANLLSVPLAVLSVWLMYFIVRSLPHNRTTEETLSAFSERKVGAVSGFFAALFIAVSPPFWFIATRAHPLSVNIVILLGCTALLIRHSESRHWGTLYLCCLIYGLGMVQFPTMLLLSPLFGIWVLYLLWQNKEIHPVRIAKLLGITLLGYASILLVAGWFMTTETYVFREFGGMGDLLVRMLKDQYVELGRSTPDVGWLAVMLFAILPWFVVVVFPKRTLLKRQSLLGSYALHAVMVGVGLLILFNSQIAPFHILELEKLVVTPYLFVASWMGYLAGYWHIMWKRTRRHEEQWLTSVRHAIAKIHIPAQILIVSAAASMNGPLVSPHHGAPTARAARELVANLDGRTWLLSTGVMDSMIELAARDGEAPITIINMAQLHKSAYLKYLAGAVPEPRIRSLVDISLTQMLSEWERLDPQLHEKLAVQEHADIWTTFGKVPVPAGMMYLGSQDATGGGAHRDASHDLDFLAEMKETLDASTGAVEPVGRLNVWLRNQLSKLANNTGYYFEDCGRSDLAFDAYQLARQLPKTSSESTKDNISALLNLSQLAAREGRPEAEAYSAEIERFMDRQNELLQAYSLSRFWGYVRDPQAALDRGMVFAFTGKPGVAIEEIQRAVRLSGASGQRGVQLKLAELHSLDGDNEESGKLYAGILEEHPDNLQALMGLARLEILSGDLESAGEHLDRALTVAPSNLKAISMRAVLADDLGEEEIVSEYTKKLQGMTENSVDANLTLAELAIRARDYDLAREYLNGLVDREMGLARALNQLLTLDIRQGRTDLGELHVKALLQIDPRDARANLVLGTIHIARGEYNEAETALGASLEVKLTTGALNSLAWILLEKGEFEKGRDLAEKALELDPGNGAAWDTLGLALMHLERMDEAEDALLKAMEFTRNDSEIVFHLAELYEAKGDQDRALNIAKSLRGLDELPEELAEGVTRMLSRLQ